MSTTHTLRAMIVLGGILMAPAFAAAQDTTAGTLTVTATVESSIAMTFENDAAGVSLAGAGTNNATMALGTVSAHEASVPAGVTRTVTASDFTVSSPFGVKVVKANSASGSYTLAAALAAADTTNTWKINAVTLNTTDQELGNAYGYGSAVAHTVYLTVPVTAAAGAINQAIDFTATAN